MRYKEKDKFHLEQLCGKETSHGTADLLALNKHARGIIISVNKAGM